MFDNLYRIFNNVKNLSSSEAFRFAVNEDIEKFIIHINTVIQLGDLGIDSDSESLGDYAPFTVELRSLAGLQVDHVDFKVTGDYWRSWTVNVVGDYIEINVNKERFNELVNELKFSEKHVGLTDENISILADKMLPRYIKYVTDKISK